MSEKHFPMDEKLHDLIFRDGGFHDSVDATELPKLTSWVLETRVVFSLIWEEHQNGKSIEGLDSEYLSEIVRLCDYTSYTGASDLPQHTSERMIVWMAYDNYLILRKAMTEASLPLDKIHRIFEKVSFRSGEEIMLGDIA